MLAVGAPDKEGSCSIENLDPPDPANPLDIDEGFHNNTGEVQVMCM